MPFDQVVRIAGRCRERGNIERIKGFYFDFNLLLKIKISIFNRNQVNGLTIARGQMLVNFCRMCRNATLSTFLVEEGKSLKAVTDIRATQYIVNTAVNYPTSYASIMNLR